MHKGDFDKGIERVEKLFGQEQNVYDEATLTEIYKTVRHLDADQWDGVVGAVVRTWQYKTLPNISAFEKMKNELGRSGQHTRKIHEDCPTCASHGLRWFVYRYNERFREGVCLCHCPNAENFTAPPHMTIEQAKRLPGFKAAERPGEVAHLLEALNPAPPPREPGAGDKKYPKHRQVAFAAGTPQEPRHGKGGPGVAGDPAPSSTQTGSHGHRETSRPPGTLIDTAAELAGDLDASQRPRQHNQGAAERKRATQMVNDLNDWLSDDDKDHVPF